MLLLGENELLYRSLKTKTAVGAVLVLKKQFFLYKIYGVLSGNGHLLHGIAITYGNGAVFHGVKIYRNAIGSAVFVLTAVPFAN